MARTFKELREFDHSFIGVYCVERQFHGWEWRYESSWETKSAAYYAAEKLSRTTGDKTRVLVESIE